MPEDGHPDEIVISAPVQAPERPASNPRVQPPQQPQQPNRAPSAPPQNRPPHTPNNQQAQRPPPAGGYVPQNRPASVQPQQPAQAAPPPGTESVGFFSAKAINQIPESSISGTVLAPQAQQMFNPKAESPSIRKTPGIDHTSSRPLLRTGEHAPPAASQSEAPSRGNSSSFTPVRPSMGAPRGNAANPALDYTRRVGAPAGSGSPLGNRSSFKQPTMTKRPPPGDSNGTRHPLADVPANMGMNAAGAGLEAKRQKMG